MIERGWDHAALNDMDEQEFRWWFSHQLEMDRLKAEAMEEKS